MSNSEPVSSLKGIGEKTGKLFEKLGVITIDDLLSYYPRAYDTYEPPVPVGQLKEQIVMSVAAALPKPPDLLRTGKIQMVSAYVRDITGALQYQKRADVCIPGKSSKKTGPSDDGAAGSLYGRSL